MKFKERIIEGLMLGCFSIILMTIILFIIGIVIEGDLSFFMDETLWKIGLSIFIITFGLGFFLNETQGGSE